MGVLSTRLRLLGLAIGVSIAPHVIRLGGAHLLLADASHVEAAREDVGVSRLDLRRTEDDTRRTGFARALDPVRSRIPQGIELGLEVRALRRREA